MLPLANIEKLSSASKRADFPPPFGPTNTVIGDSCMLVALWIIKLRIVNSWMYISQAGFFPVRFLARARFRFASSFRIACFGTVSDLRNARSKVSNWFGPSHLSFKSAIVSAWDFTSSPSQSRFGAGGGFHRLLCTFEELPLEARERMIG